MEVKKHSRSDFYPTYKKWCEAHSFPVSAEGFFPETAFVCYNDEIPIYGIWFWNTDSMIAWIGFAVSDYTIDFRLKNGGLDYLIKEVVTYAKEMGYKTVFTTSGTESVIEALEKNKFIEGDVNVNQYFAVL